MNKLNAILSSRTVWTVLAMFVFNGLQAIAPMVSGNISVAVNFILGGLAIYFRSNPQAQL